MRARITEKLEASEHTSMKKRLEAITHSENNFSLDQDITAMAGDVQAKQLSITLREYTALTEWAGRSIIHPNKAAIPANIAAVLDRLNLQPTNWLNQVGNYSNNYCRVVGPIEKNREKAAKLNKRYFRGISAAKRLYVSR